MKRSILYLSVFVSVLASCKQENVSPKKNFRGTTSLSGGSSNSSQKVSLIGTWTWSAQYSYGNPPPVYLFTPFTTGITETLSLGSDSTWSQTQNGAVVNSGTFRMLNVFTPGGPTVFLNLVNSKANNSVVYDYLDFSRGFSSSYFVSKDSLVFYGVYNISAYTNLASERVYVK
jgi:hypothetical protein